jgi:hypothetical protein
MEGFLRLRRDWYQAAGPPLFRGGTRLERINPEFVPAPRRSVTERDALIGDLVIGELAI